MLSPPLVTFEWEEIMAIGQQRGRNQRVQEAQAQAADHAEVARLAYELYEQRGRVGGYDLDDWLRAEAMVRQRRRQTPGERRESRFRS